jgi:acyl carrier protein
MLPDDLEELINTLNEEFELDIPDVDAEDWETVRDVVNYVLEKIDHE